jgi:hypothetical protein
MVLGIRLLDGNVTYITLQSRTEYVAQQEYGLSNEVELTVQLDALQGVGIGRFREKFNALVGDNVRKMLVEAIRDANTDQLKRIEITFSGEGGVNVGNQDTDTVIAKLTIPAEYISNELLTEAPNLFDLIQAAIGAEGSILEISAQRTLDELAAAVIIPDYAEYEVRVEDGVKDIVVYGLGLSAVVRLEFERGFEVQEKRSILYERGVISGSVPYIFESYGVDSYVAQPGKSWDELTVNALSGLWEYVTEGFAWATHAVEAGADWVVGTATPIVNGIVEGGARLFGLNNQQFALASADIHVSPTSVSDISITTVSWLPQQSSLASSSSNPSIVQSASGSGFVIGGIHDFTPYSLTLSPAATLVLTYTDSAVAEIDESQIGMFRWNSNGAYWQKLEATANTQSNEYSTQISRLGIFALGYDATKPTATILEPANGEVVSNRQPLIRAQVVDEGVGIDPQSVRVYLNWHRVLASYMPSTGEIIYLPSDALVTGKHTVAIMASDAIGNQVTYVAIFTIADGNLPAFNYPVTLQQLAPLPPACLLRASENSNQSTLIINGGRFNSNDHSVQFRRMDTGELSSSYRDGITWQSDSQFSLDISVIEKSLWTGSQLTLVARLIDRNNTPVSDWSSQFILAENALVCGNLITDPGDSVPQLFLPTVSR